MSHSAIISKDWVTLRLSYCFQTALDAQTLFAMSVLPIPIIWRSIVVNDSVNHD